MHGYYFGKKWKVLKAEWHIQTKLSLFLLYYLTK